VISLLTVVGDCNDANIIVDPSTHHLTGLIDFGDSVYTWTIADIAIAMAYASVSSPDNPLPGMCALLAAYCAECGPLSPFESEHLPVPIPPPLCLNCVVDFDLCSLDCIDCDGRILYLQGPHK
jgi:hydroxylysine kinase